MKKYLLISLLMSGAIFARGQQVESIYVNLYTDSLKKGTFNYINIDGKLSNGRFLPLDNKDLVFWSSAGRFEGNNLWIDNDIAVQKVDIKVTLKNNPAMAKEFTIYIKQRPDPELKTVDEIMNKPRSRRG